MLRELRRHNRELEIQVERIASALTDMSFVLANLVGDLRVEQAVDKPQKVER